MLTRTQRAAFARVVIHRELPDGEEASDDQRLAMIALCYEEDSSFADLLAVAAFGEHLDGRQASWENGERERALDEIDRMTSGPVERPASPAFVDAVEDQTAAGASSREQRRRLADATLEEPTFRAGAVRGDTMPALEAAAAELGWQPSELLRPIKRGRPSAAEAARREALARAVYRAKRAGAQQEAIAAAIRILPPRVSELVELGKTLEEGSANRRNVA